MTCTSCVMNKSDKAVVFGGPFSCLDLTPQNYLYLSQLGEINIYI